MTQISTEMQAKQLVSGEINAPFCGFLECQSARATYLSNKGIAQIRCCCDSPEECEVRPGTSARMRLPALSMDYKTVIFT
jgi:hypothetical protein